MTQRDIAELLTILSKAYPNNKVEDMKATLALWTGYFMNYDKEVVFTATKHYINSHVFFPSIAELRECVDKFDTMKRERVPAIGTGESLKDAERGTGCCICPYDDFCQARNYYKCIV